MGNGVKKEKIFSPLGVKEKKKSLRTNRQTNGSTEGGSIGTGGPIV